MHPDRGLDALQVIEERAGIERGSANECQSWLADLFAALGVKSNGAFCLSGSFGSSGSKGWNSGKVCRRCITLASRNMLGVSGCSSK